MFCPNCGTRNSDTAKFCTNCASALHASQSLPASPDTYTAGPPTYAPGAGVSDGLRIGIAILSFLIPIVGIVMGVIYMNDPNPEKKRAGKLWLIVSALSIAIGFVSCCFFGSLSGILHDISNRM